MKGGTRVGYRPPIEVKNLLKKPEVLSALNAQEPITFTPFKITTGGTQSQLYRFATKDNQSFFVKQTPALADIQSQQVADNNIRNALGKKVVNSPFILMAWKIYLNERNGILIYPEIQGVMLSDAIKRGVDRDTGQFIEPRISKDNLQNAYAKIGAALSQIHIDCMENKGELDDFYTNGDLKGKNILVHGDFQASNIMFSEEGKLYFIDTANTEINSHDPYMNIREGLAMAKDLEEKKAFLQGYLSNYSKDKQQMVLDKIGADLPLDKSILPEVPVPELNITNVLTPKPAVAPKELVNVSKPSGKKIVLPKKTPEVTPAPTPRVTSPSKSPAVAVSPMRTESENQPTEVKSFKETRELFHNISEPKSSSRVSQKQTTSKPIRKQVEDQSITKKVENQAKMPLEPQKSEALPEIRVDFVPASQFETKFMELLTKKVIELPRGITERQFLEYLQGKGTFDNLKVLVMRKRAEPDSRKRELVGEKGHGDYKKLLDELAVKTKGKREKERSQKTQEYEQQPPIAVKPVESKQRVQERPKKLDDTHRKVIQEAFAAKQVKSGIEATKASETTMKEVASAEVDPTVPPPPPLPLPGKKGTKIPLKEGGDSIDISVIEKRLEDAAESGIVGVNKPIKGDKGVVSYLVGNTVEVESRKLSDKVKERQPDMSKIQEELKTKIEKRKEVLKLQKSDNVGKGNQPQVNKIIKEINPNKPKKPTTK